MPNPVIDGQLRDDAPSTAQRLLTTSFASRTLQTILATILIVIGGATRSHAATAQSHAGAAESNAGAARERVIGLPCEGCEDVFEGRPSRLASVVRIAPEGEPGETMRIEGTVRDLGGRPAPGIIVYAYHTDAGGRYPRGIVRHGRLRAWAQTDESGRYRFDTIRPGGYPDTDIPQHVHMHVIEPGCCTYYIDDIMFDDDPRLTPELRRRFSFGRGGDGFVHPRRDERGTWRVTRDIVLGKEIAGYGQRR